MSDRDAVRKNEEMCFEANCHETGCRITKGMCDHVAPFGTPISISSPENRVGKQWGTRSYINLSGLKLLLSCQRVLRKLKTQPVAQRE